MAGLIKEGPLSGSLPTRFKQLTHCNCMTILRVRSPLLGTKISLKLPINQANTVV